MLYPKKNQLSNHFPKELLTGILSMNSKIDLNITRHDIDSIFSMLYFGNINNNTKAQFQSIVIHT